MRIYCKDKENGNKMKVNLAPLNSINFCELNLS